MNQNNQKPRYTETKFNQDATNAIMRGVNLVADAVNSTLGPLGRNSLLEESWGKHTILHDGVRTAMAIIPEDPFERAGAKLIQEAGQRQRDSVGDGTSVCTLLTQAILKETLKITAAGVPVMSLRAELEAGAQKVIHKLSQLSQPIKTLEQLKEIAIISAEDKELGDLIAGAIYRVGGGR